MRVPEYNEQSRYKSTNIPGPRLKGAEVQTNAAMFGAQSGQDLERAGHALQRTGNQVAYLVDDYNTTKAREAASAFQQDFLAWQTEASKKVGKEGINTGADYDQWAQRRVQELGKGMSNVQRGRFQSFVGERAALQKRWAEGYGYEQDGVYKMSTWKTAMSTAGDTIASNPNDPDMVRQAVEQIKDSSFSIAKHKGLDDQAGAVLMQEHVAEYLGGTILQQIQQGKTGIASTLMAQYGKEIGGVSMGKLNVAMKREQEHQAVKARAAQAEQRFNMVNGAATELMDQVKSGNISHSDALLKIRELPDAKDQHAVRASFQDLVIIDRQMTHEEEQGGRAEASDAYDKLGNDLNSKWNAVQEAGRAALGADVTPRQKAYAKHMKELYKADVEFAEGGIKSGSNPAAFDAMQEAVQQGITLTQAKGSEYWPQLSTSARRSFETSIKEGLKYDSGEAIRLYDEMQMKRVGRKYSKDADQGDREAFLQFALENTRATGRGKDPVYIQQLVDQWWMKGTRANSGFFDDSGTYGKLHKQGKFLPTIEDNRRQEILDMFNANPEIKEAWKNAYGGNMNYAIRGYHSQQQMKLTNPRGAR